MRPAVQWDAEASFGHRNAGTACESSRARGERLKSDKICLTLTEKLGEVIWGYL